MIDASISLLAITDRRVMPGELVACATALMERRRENVIVQLREKDLDARPLFEVLAALVPVAERTRSRVMINGRADIARCFAPAVGLHVPEDGFPLEEARRLLPGVFLGASAHDLEGALRAARTADLLTLAPIFPTPSKPDVRALGLEAFAKIAGAVRAQSPHVKVYGLGGVDATNAASVLRAGAGGVAAIRAAWR